MSAQNWGELSKPKRGGHHRRSSEYDLAPNEQGQSLDTQPPPRANRISIQTACTEAPTESIFAPESPTASNVTPQGLAPRPPSYHGADMADFATESSDRKPRRMPYDDEDEYFLQASPPLPEAPGVPRGPPVSFRPSYQNPMPQAPAPRQEAATRHPPRPSISDDHSYPRSREMPPSAAQDPMAGSTSAASTRPRAPEASGQPRRTSMSATSDRRKKLATNRSPLQNLELTLDSMTKEEKRARVEAAEQRARQRAARNAQLAVPSSNDDSAASRSTAPKQQTQLPTPRQQVLPYATDSRPPPSAHHDWSQQIQRNDAQPPAARAYQQLDEYSQNLDQSSLNIPKRNLSFKDRATRNPVVPRNVETLEPAKRMISPPTDFLPPNHIGTSKSGNELPENFHQQRRIGSESLPRSSGPAQRATSGAFPHSAKNKELPPLPPSAYDNSDHEVLVPKPRPVQGIQRRATEPTYRHGHEADVRQSPVPSQPQYSTETPHGAHQTNLGALRPGQSLYQPPQWLDEWEKAAVGSLSGPLLDVHAQDPPQDNYKAWWEQDKVRGTNATSRLRKAEAFDGEYDDTNEPTRFKPQLYLKCGPLLRYCGIRKEAIPSRSHRGNPVSEREMWRGSIMIVTKDSASSYEIAPMLRLFVQDIGLLPPPAHHVNGELPPEYVDPIAGHPKLGRRGETLHVRPVEHLEEGKDLSMDETDNGLFETSRSPPDAPPPDGSGDLPGSFASRKKRAGVDGEKVQKYKDVRGFQLHAERGYTFWRFNIEIELREKQQRIAYRINRGPSMAFWVPARGQTMNIMFYSCNGFSTSVKPDDFSGPDPMWRDVLSTHQLKPFHVMIGGGNQIYNDCVVDQCELFEEWFAMRNPFKKQQARFTAEVQNQLEEFYLERYCMWFSQGLFGLATSQIPMVNMYDDHDMFDGYGSYPDHDMRSPMLSGLGAVAFKYYILFQHQSVVPETETSEPSWILGDSPGPYIQELSRSVYVSLGGKTALLAVDCRTERTEHEVLDERTWEKITSRLYLEVRRGQVEHLLVLIAVPIAYPRMVWLENLLTSGLMGSVKALGKTGVFGKSLNNIGGGVEALEDLNDHWTDKNHKQERSIVIEDLQDLAMDKSVRVTILSGNVQLAAVGQFYSNPQMGLAKHKDPRYMPNIISSAIVNTPPPDMLADMLNKRNKVHHFDKNTDEDMIPLFQYGPDGKLRNNKRLLPHRNWCSICPWSPGATPPPTPPLSDHDRSPSPPPATGSGGLLRRFSLSKRSGPMEFDGSRESVRGSRPPISGGMLRSLTRRSSEKNAPRPAKLTRSMSLGSAGRPKAGLFGFLRRDSQSKAAEYDEGDDNSMGRWDAPAQGPYPSPYGQSHEGSLRLRGGGGQTIDEYSDGDDAYFSQRSPQRANTAGSQPTKEPFDDPRIRPFHRTPTGLTSKQMKNAQNLAVDLEGGLDICLNVEVNPKDPTGATVPYRLLVPRLHCKFPADEDSVVEAEAQPQPQAQLSGFKRFLSFRKKPEPQATSRGEEYDAADDEERDYDDESTNAGTVTRRY